MASHPCPLRFAAGRLISVERAGVFLFPVIACRASAKGKDVLPGWSCEWLRTYDNEFAGTSVSVVILTAVRA